MDHSGRLLVGLFRAVATVVPTVLPTSVVSSAPRGGGGPGNKVVMWSFPVIDDGLIYVVDVRSGLHILRYTGRGARDVRRIDFLEGNSNLGDARRLNH